MIHKKKTIPFLVAVSYLASFLLIRLAVIVAGSAESEYAQVAKAGQLPGTNFYIGSNVILFGYHIHHFYFGILLIILAGWFGIVGSRTLKKEHVAVMYGAGLGLFLDEIGLLLTWGDYYSNLTYMISLAVLGIFFNFLFFGNFWLNVKENFRKSPVMPSSVNTLFKRNIIFHFADRLSNKITKTDKSRQVFTGGLLILVSVLVVVFPHSVRYWIAGGFIIQGASNLIIPFSKKEDEDGF